MHVTSVYICTQWAPGVAPDMNSMWPVHKILISLLGFQSGCRPEHHILLFLHALQAANQDTEQLAKDVILLD